MSRSIGNQTVGYLSRLLFTKTNRFIRIISGIELHLVYDSLNEPVHESHSFVKLTALIALSEYSTAFRPHRRKNVCSRTLTESKVITYVRSL